MSRHEPEPVRITTATTSHSDDIDARQRRYLISMGVRTVCFVLAILTRTHWFVWVFLAASFVLPYVAVILANSGTSHDSGGPGYFSPDHDARVLEGPRSGD